MEGFYWGERVGRRVEDRRAVLYRGLKWRTRQHRVRSIRKGSCGTLPSQTNPEAFIGRILLAAYFDMLMQRSWWQVLLS